MIGNMKEQDNDHNQDDIEYDAEFNDNMAHSHIEHSDPKEKEEHKKQSETDLKTVRKVTEHPELR